MLRLGEQRPQYTGKRVILPGAEPEAGATEPKRSKGENSAGAANPWARRLGTVVQERQASGAQS